MTRFREAYATAVWRLPHLMIYTSTWIKRILPHLRLYPFEHKYDHLADVNQLGLEQGWVLGEENPTGLALNQRSYDENAAGTNGRVAMAEDFSKDLTKGRNTPWLGEIVGVLPMFVDPKKRCPITGIPTQWRVIRDASCGAPPFHAINSLTPKIVGKVQLTSKIDTLKHMKIMYLIYGPDILIAKTDLDGAFRQFFVAITETQKIVYKFDDKAIAEFQNIWGSVSGSRICQDMTECIARFSALRVNGEKLLHDINKATEEQDVIHLELKLQMHRTIPLLPDDKAYTPGYLTKHPRDVTFGDIKQHTEVKGPDEAKIWTWSAGAVKCWLVSISIERADSILSIQNGIHLMR